jgi:hypothetical protein
MVDTVDTSNQSDTGMAIEAGLHPFWAMIQYDPQILNAMCVGNKPCSARCSIYFLLNRCAMVCTSNKDIRFISHFLKVLIEPLQGSGVQDSWNPRNKGAFRFLILSRLTLWHKPKKFHIRNSQKLHSMDENPTPRPILAPFRSVSQAAMLATQHLAVSTGLGKWCKYGWKWRSNYQHLTGIEWDSMDICVGIYNGTWWDYQTWLAGKSNLNWVL